MALYWGTSLSSLHEARADGVIGLFALFELLVQCGDAGLERIDGRRGGLQLSGETVPFRIAGADGAKILLLTSHLRFQLGDSAAGHPQGQRGRSCEFAAQRDLCPE